MDRISKNISVSDDVYEALKRRKRGRSFSDTIRETIEASGQITDVVGQGIFQAQDLERIKTDIERLSNTTLTRLDEAQADEAA